ncbi:hypothetical protein GCM10010885_18800 [Alicyclobacillus cellulosilyticus]|uniref:Sulfocyanin-like C-terminal domain-containing protein n=1 Tax=Alicyclobacillus cellulosilyticus TaxID=1003997 RepID=A0A917KE22_9BACL|nr:sulfocyanin-like copper-binding protein [Alicyclobacillus cellulosilyticus]GGJ09900.1 hypothetical protein GCM10010885_18800 [Alicyclobacillus cellulosilyticus]
MRLSPVGTLVTLLGAVVGIVIWVVAYFGLPNDITHRDLAKNPKLATSVTSTGSETTTGSAAGNATGGAPAAAQPAWYHLGKSPHTLVIALTAAATPDKQGLNFNGYSDGQLKITVPLGWKVDVAFSNKDPNIPHSVAFVAYKDRAAMQLPQLAFPGAASPNPAVGITAAGGTQHFSFTADKAGRYALMCAVPGHAMNGMWDEFDVSASAKVPAITTGGTTVEVGSSAFQK